MQTPAKRGLDECYEVHKSNKRVSGVLWVQFPSYWSVLSSKGLGKKQPFSHFLMLKMITFKDRLTNMWENSKHCRFIAGMGAAPVTRSPLHTAAGALVHTLRAVLTFAARSTVMHGFLHAPNLDHLPGARRHRSSSAAGARARFRIQYQCSEAAQRGHARRRGALPDGVVVPLFGIGCPEARVRGAKSGAHAAPSGRFLAAPAGTRVASSLGRGSR